MASAADARQALLLCSDLLALPQGVESRPAEAAKTLLLALRAKREFPRVAPRGPAPPPRE